MCAVFRLYRHWFIMILFFGATLIHAQSPSVPTSIAALENRIATLSQAQDSAGLQTLFNDLQRANRIPFVIADTVLFLYNGTSNSAGWSGDFNRWSAVAPGTRYRMNTTSSTSIWTLKLSLPLTARVDYKIVLAGNNFILDPANPLQQWGGFGPNSELRMGDFRPSPDASERVGIARGRITSAQRFTSRALGYDVQYTVYLPPHYDSTRTYPSLYVMDGQEYSDSRLGALPTVLDNLTADGLIGRGIITIFVDPRNPDNLGNNRRQSEYATTPAHLQYLVGELIPRIDSTYRTIQRADSRGVLGTSLGGLTSAYCAISRPDIFGITGIHSPAFWFRTGIFNQWRDSAMRPIRIIMTTGTMFDTQDDARTMRNIMQNKGYTLQYREVPQGHSWGNWRFLMSETIRGMFAPAASSIRMTPTQNLSVSVTPNPVSDSMQILFSLRQPTVITIEILDMQGKSVYRGTEPRSAGEHTVILSAHGYANGRYTVRVQGTDVSGSIPLVIAR